MVSLLQNLYSNNDLRNGPVNQNSTIVFEREHSNLLEVVPSSIEMYPGGPEEFMVTILGKSPGHSLVTTNVTSNTIMK